MIKLKLTREQLEVMTACFNPKEIEKATDNVIENGDFRAVSYVFLLVEVGEKLTKKLYFSLADKNKITLTYAQGAAVLEGILQLEYNAVMFASIMQHPNADTTDFSKHVLREIKGSIHQQLHNYKRRFYDNTPTSYTTGYHSLNQITDHRLAGSPGYRADSLKG